MFLLRVRRVLNRLSLPHASGDVSVKLSLFPQIDKSSPCEWGCFLVVGDAGVIESVFPMRVGMFLSEGRRARFNSSLPHASGDVSVLKHFGKSLKLSSPCEWGCFPLSKTA